MSMSPRGAAGASAELAGLGRMSAAGPDIPRPRSRWRSRVLLPLVVFAAAAVVLVYAARDVVFQPIEVRVVPVIARSSHAADGSANEASPGAAAAAIQAPGWIEPDPYAVNVPALVDGVVREVRVLEGEAVTQGQVVAILIDDELRLAERSAAAVVAERRSDVGKARAALEPLRSAIAVAQAEADVIRDELDRKRELVKVGGVGAAVVARLEIRLRGAWAEIEKARGELASGEATAAQAEAALETARALLAEAQLRLERAEVRSSASGVVLARLVAPGSRIAATSKASESSDMTSTVLRLYDPSHLQARADVPLADAARIGPGTPAEVTTEALPGEKFSGRVTRVVHEANIQRNTVQFKVSIDHPSPLLKPEMLVRVRFNPGHAAGGAGPDDSGLELLLPASVLSERIQDRAMVWLLEVGDSAKVFRAVRREARLGEEHDGEVVVVSGVKPGDRVISEPPSSLRPGARVRVAPESVPAAGPSVNR